MAWILPRKAQVVNHKFSLTEIGLLEVQDLKDSSTFSWGNVTSVVAGVRVTATNCCSTVCGTGATEIWSSITSSNFFHAPRKKNVHDLPSQVEKWTNVLWSWAQLRLHWCRYREFNHWNWRCKGARRNKCRVINFCPEIIRCKCHVFGHMRQRCARIGRDRYHEFVGIKWFQELRDIGGAAWGAAAGATVFFSSHDVVFGGQEWNTRRKDGTTTCLPEACLLLNSNAKRHQVTSWGCTGLII